MADRRGASVPRGAAMSERRDASVPPVGDRGGKGKKGGRKPSKGVGKAGKDKGAEDPEK